MSKSKLMEQTEVAVNDEATSTGMLNCKITGITSRSQGEFEEEKFMRINLTIRLDKFTDEILEILPHDLVAMLVHAKNKYPFRSIAFEISGEKLVILRMQEAIVGVPFFKAPVIFNRAGVIKAVERSLFLKTSFDIGLDAIDGNLPYNLQAVFNSPILCSLTIQQTELGL